MEVQGRGSDSESEAERKGGRGEKRFGGGATHAPKCVRMLTKKLNKTNYYHASSGLLEFNEVQK